MSAAGRDLIVYGIDFGMSTSSLAVLRRDGVTGRWDSSPTLVTDPALPGQVHTIPSAVFQPEAGAELVAGTEAVNLKGRRPEAYRDNFKREVRSQSAPAVLAGTRVEPATMIAGVLKLLRRRAAELGLGEPTVIMLTHPVEWSSGQIAVLVEAARLAGFPTKALYEVQEPKAAWEYACQAGAIRRKDKALIYDLGGGTFDCAVINPFGDDAPPIAASGGCEIGGRDFDTALFQSFKRAMPSVATVERGPAGNQLLSTCEQIKKRLSVDANVQEYLVELPEQPRVEVTRPEFEAMIAQKVDQTLAACERTLHEAGLSWSQLDAVVPVGGSTLIPLITSELGRKAAMSITPVDDRETAVARGAALLAARKADELVNSGAVGSTTITPASIWTPQAAGPPAQVVVAQSSFNTVKASSALNYAFWIALAAAGTGYTAWRDWPFWAQVAAGAATAIMFVSVILHSSSAARRTKDGVAWTVGTIATGFIGAEIIAVVVNAYRSVIEHQGEHAGFAWEAFGAGILWCIVFGVSVAVMDRASRARKEVADADAAKSAEARLTRNRWFSTKSETAPAFIESLFAINALRCFELPPSSGMPAYALVAGEAAVFVGRLADPGQRPRLGEQMQSWAKVLDLPASSVRSILVVPGFVPPKVSASELFDMQAFITTEIGIKDIIGPWLERDNRVCMPVLQKLLRQLDQQGTVHESA